MVDGVSDRPQTALSAAIIAVGSELLTPEKTDTNSLYITQVLNWVFSPFNPADYTSWSRRPLAHWASQPAVRRMIRSLIDDVPVAVLNHVERVAEPAP